MDQLASGSKDAINLIVSRHYQKLENYVKQNRGSTEEAQDLMQESMYEMFKKSKRANRSDIENFDAYFATVYRNLWKKQLLVKKRNQEGMKGFTAEESPGEENYYIYLKAFAELGMDCQQILNDYIAGVKVSKIAEQLNTTVNYAKRKKYLCKEQLKKIAHQYLVIYE